MTEVGTRFRFVNVHTVTFREGNHASNDIHGTRHMDHKNHA